MDIVILEDWAAFAVRWLHVITAIAWIGSSFYFIALDLGLTRTGDLPQGVNGEAWQVHGGGFYHIRKYMVAPERLPERLTWFKWESYATWLSGFATLCLVYYARASLFLVDPSVMPMPVPVAIALSVGSLAVGWLAYDALCRSRVGQSTTGLMLVLYAILVAASWGYAHVFAGRAALLHVGALTATLMTANVFLVIIPNQRIVVADLRTGRVPDAEYGRVAKQRSLHNNYLTLPVVFLMLSNHEPLAFAGPWNWAIASLVFLMGVTIRHFFNTMHAHKGRPWWTWGLTAAIFAAIVWLSWPSGEAGPATPQQAADRGFAAAPGFETVAETVETRCSMCHAAQPLWPGIASAPRGVRLETPAEIAHHARDIFLQAGITHAMPPANVTEVSPAERAAIVAWYEAALRGTPGS